MVDRSTLIDVSPSPVECVGVLLQHRPIAAPGNHSNLTVYFTAVSKKLSFHSNCATLGASKPAGENAL
jgi:hypothetical protein